MDWLTWLMDQAKTASPLFAVACLGACAVLWRQHIRDMKTIQVMYRSQMKAMGAVSRNLATLTAKIRASGR